MSQPDNSNNGSGLFARMNLDRDDRLTHTDRDIDDAERAARTHDYDRATRLREWDLLDCDE